MSQSLSLFLAAVLLVSCRAADPPNPHWVVPPNPKATEEATEAQELQAFQRQDKKDELIKITENSFLGPEMKPLAGRPVLLAAGVRTWNRRSGESDDDPNMVQFEVVQGQGRLVYFTEFIPGKPAPGPVQRRLVVPAMDGYEAFVWFIPDNAAPQEAVVKATLAPMGQRQAFIDTQSEVVFHVHSIPTFGAPQWDVKQVRAQTYRNLAVPHSEFFDYFTFTYPSSFGVFQWEPRSSIYSTTKLRFFRKDYKGVVAEASDWEENRNWYLEMTKWHTLPLDLTGMVTHVDATKGRAALVTYTQYNPDLKDPGQEQFRQSRWEISQYLTAYPQAGPEDQWTLRTEEEDPNSPLQVEVSRIRRSGIENKKGVLYWDQTVRWTSAVANIHSIYDLVVQRMIDFQPARTFPEESLEKSLESRADPMPQGLSDEKLDSPSEEGFSFQNLTASLEKKFEKTGHPPGVVVTHIASASPLVSLGLLPGDVILMANWTLTPTVGDLDKALRSRGAEESLTLLFWHLGSYHWLEWTPPTS